MLVDSCIMFENTTENIAWPYKKKNKDSFCFPDIFFISSSKMIEFAVYCVLIMLQVVILLYLLCKHN